MDKKKLILGSMIIIVAVFSLKATGFPGVGPLCCIIAFTIANLIAVLSLGSKSKIQSSFLKNIKFKNEEDEFAELNAEESAGDGFEEVSNDEYSSYGSKKFIQMTEYCLLLGLSILIYGALFKVQHWPGANAMLNVGFFSALITAVATLIIVKKSNCRYAGELKQVAIATIIFGGIIGTKYFYNWIETTRYKDYTHFVEVFNKSQEDNSQENQRACSIERSKVLALGDAESYNHLNELDQKAQALAANDSNAIAVYIICDRHYYIYDKTGEYYDIMQYANQIQEKVNENTTLYLVSNTAENAQKILMRGIHNLKERQIVVVQ